MYINIHVLYSVCVLPTDIAMINIFYKNANICTS